MNSIRRLSISWVKLSLSVGLIFMGICVEAQSPSTITIDPIPTAEPMSPYIYGQFIEHLGRCIYGGIWAEMLDDRKFYHPVGWRESPWRAVGDAKVEMDKKDPFVGEHTPVVTLEGREAGIVQGGLALRKGMSYVGRVWLAGDSSAAPIQVRLLWGDGTNERQTDTITRISSQYTKYSLRFTAAASSDSARLEIVSSGSGTFRVGTVSLMPADNVRGMRADTLKALKELDAPIYRWPGGNFVSGYDWRDGLGDPDRRPPRKNPAWLGVEHNDFGIHEFMEFCKEVRTEPLVVVNTGFGDAHSAAEEVEYVNGAAGTAMGRWRAKNGRSEPWKVVWWGVGNEMWGPWQLGFMKLDQYVQKHNDVERQMKRVDPGIKTVGSGELGGGWSEGMLKNSADHMDLISEHFYVQERQDVAAHVAQVPNQIRRKAEAHRAFRKKLASLHDKDIRICMDEWNYWYGPHVYGELGTRYFLKDGLGIAAGLHEFSRNTDIISMANYAQTVNVIGAIKTTKTDAALETTGLVLKLYRQHFGNRPLKVDGVPAPLDVAAALTDDRKVLTLGVVNPTSTVQVLTLNGVALLPTGKSWRMAGSDPMVFNEPGVAPRVNIVESVAESGSLTVPPYSVTVYRWELRR